jgi:Ca2+-binding RTX toxin-like protein
VAVPGVKIDGENLNGANDPDNSAAAGTADYNDACTTDATGTCTITVTASESQIGTSDFCFWADADSDTAFDPAGTPEDGGQCGEAVSPDDTDQTDVVEKSWEARAVSYVDVTPDADVNMKGTSHTVTVTSYDQFDEPIGGQRIDIVITGRNPQTFDDVVTNAQGVYTFTYTDSNAAGEGDDTIDACVDNNDNDICDVGTGTDTATKRWIDEAATASDVEVDMQGCNGNLADLTDTTGGNAWNDTATNPVGTSHEVCASAMTVGGETLYGHTVTFTTAGPGMFVDADGNDLGPTVDVEIAPDGYAHVTLYSEASGDQVVTATIDGQTDTGTKTWTALDARNIDLEPETATNPPGTLHLVTATVTDIFGNGVPGVTVTFTETGAGVFRNGSSTVTAVTDASGVATAETTTLATETGVQTITASMDPAPASNDCELLVDVPNPGDAAGNCSDEVTKTWGPTCPGFEGDSRNQIVGTPGPDVLVGTTDDDIICGLGGKDTLRGRLGNDKIKGGAGDDLMKGGGGDDALNGGKGPDTAFGNAGTDRCRSAVVKKGCES